MTTPANFDTILSGESALEWVKGKSSTEVIDQIRKLAGNKKKAQWRENSLVLFGTYFAGVTPAQEWSVLENWDIVLGLASDYQGSISEKARDLSRLIFDHYTKYSCKGYLTIGGLLTAVSTGSKLPTKRLGFEYLNELINSSQKEVRANLETIVPKVAESFGDITKEVGPMVEETMKLLCQAIENVDIDPFIAPLINVFRDPDNATEVIHGLAGVTFVQEVDAATLSIIVPVLMLGFRSKVDATKRLSAVIVANMIKLVNDPREVANYLPKLLPLLESASRNVSEPEARSVCGKAYQQLLDIQAKIAELPLAPKVEVVAEEPIKTYATRIIELLVVARDLELDVKWNCVY